jgi:hypothetical protein
MEEVVGDVAAREAFRQDFDCRYTVVVHISDCFSILHVHAYIAQARLAALFVYPATVSFRE